MKRFLFTADVKQAEGSQVFFVDATTLEEAAAEMERGGGTIYTEDLSVMDISKPYPDGETTLDDFGDFPPAPPAWDGSVITDAQLQHFIEARDKNWAMIWKVGFDTELARQLLAVRKQLAASVQIQEAWKACGGNPGITATAEELICALEAMNAAEDEVEEASGRILNNEQWAKVQQILDAPAEPSQALIDLMTRPRRLQVSVPELSEQDKADRVLRVNITSEPQPVKSEQVLAAEALAQKVEEIGRNHDARAAKLRRDCQPMHAEPYDLWLLRSINSIIDFVAGPGEQIKSHTERNRVRNVAGYQPDPSSAEPAPPPKKP